MGPVDPLTEEPPHAVAGVLLHHLHELLGAGGLPPEAGVEVAHEVVEDVLRASVVVQEELP